MVKKGRIDRDWDPSLNLIADLGNPSSLYLAYPFPCLLFPFHSIPHYHIMSYHVISYSVRSYPILSYPILSYPIQFYSIISPLIVRSFCYPIHYRIENSSSAVHYYLLCALIRSPLSSISSDVLFYSLLSYSILLNSIIFSCFHFLQFLTYTILKILEFIEFLKFLHFLQFL